MQRMRCEALKDKIMSADEAACFIEDNMFVGTSGFTPAGYPKAVPLALAKRVREGANIKINLITGASVGPEIDSELSSLGIIKRRLPYQTDSEIRKYINNGNIAYCDMHLSHSPQYIEYNFLGKMDVAIIEAVAITETGGIVLSTSVGNSPVFVEHADKVIVEINTSQPQSLEGIHDVYITRNPPDREPIPIIKPCDRIGTEYIPCDPAKIVAVVYTDIKDKTNPVAPITDISKKMAENLIMFLKSEIAKDRLPKNLLPIQSGVGSVANAILGGLCNSDFKNLEIYSEVLQDSVIDLIDAGKVTCASATSLTLSPEKISKVYEDFSKYKKYIVLRPEEISNNPEVVRRLGIISINTAIEADIYGNVNSTTIMGSKMMNGIGGSGDFTRNAYLSIFTTESIAKNGSISSIVPMVSHHDHTEHDVMVIVTEQGVADLRGLCPKEKAEVIIENCCHPDYRSMLRDYFNRACELSNDKHTPHILEEALSWHERYLNTKSMKR